MIQMQPESQLLRLVLASITVDSLTTVENLAARRQDQTWR